MEEKKTEREAAELEKEVQGQPSVTVDYSAVNLKQLTVTNDKKIYEKMKADNSTGVLFEPSAFKKSGFKDSDEIYIIGILQDK